MPYLYGAINRSGRKYTGKRKFSAPSNKLRIKVAALFGRPSIHTAF